MAFMVPVAEYFSAEEATKILGQEIDVTDEPVEVGAGYYSRLIAPGFMDSTDWNGPFDTADKALEYVMDLFGVDENGVATI